MSCLTVCCLDREETLKATDLKQSDHTNKCVTQKVAYHNKNSHSFGFVVKLEQIYNGLTATVHQLAKNYTFYMFTIIKPWYFF